jgi:DNA-binding beta-propeller fold protein YncE
LSNPRGLAVDHLGNVYVADSDNQRVVRYLNGSKKGSILVGGNGPGKEPNQFNGLRGLAFDRDDNLYVVDHWNNRVQKFEINSKRKTSRDQL